MTEEKEKVIRSEMQSRHTISRPFFSQLLSDNLFVGSYTFSNFGLSSTVCKTGADLQSPDVKQLRTKGNSQTSKLPLADGTQAPKRSLR